MNKKFYLSRTDKQLAGVCGGIAEYFNINSLLVRIGMLILVLGFGVGILVYILLALLAPKGPSRIQQYKDDMNKRLHSNNYKR
ncbi:MAG: PspC domain-containing protein [Prevotellaceae bacterium]|nr:PspC domain-containing protein [Candidatus Minthosoma caballi]